jgi:hypothetical protein
LCLLQPRELFQEVPAEWVVISVPSHVSIRVSNELGNDVQVPDVCEELRELPELTIGIDLLEMRLTQAARVRVIVGIRASSELLAASPDPFFDHDRTAVVVLTKRESVSPQCTIGVDFDVDDDLGIATRVKRSQSGDAASALDGLLEASARLGDVAEEPQCIQQVGLAARVRTDDEHSLAQRNLDAQEVAPILEEELREPHRS